MDDKIKTILYHNKPNLKAILIIFLIFIIVLFFYTYRLKESLNFAHDTARDTLRIFEIWRNKELTLIGPPLSFGQLGIRQVFFGSLAYYIGIIGLLISRFDVVGPIYPNIFFFLISIPIFYLLIKILTKSKYTILISTLIYIFSPTTVTFARFFWNPNLIIPFSVFFWYLLLKKYQNQNHKFVGYIISGIIAGIMVNFHYFSLIPVLIYIMYLIFSKKKLDAFTLFIGLITGLMPLIFFELKHNFYLIQSIFFNLKGDGTSFYLNRTFSFVNFFDSIWILLGLKTSEMANPHFNYSFPNQFIIFNIILLILITLNIIKTSKKNWIFFIIYLLMNLISLKLSPDTYCIHYLFSIYPLIVWFIGSMVTLEKLKYIGLIIFIPIFISNIFIISEIPTLKKDYISTPLIEKITKTIIRDNPKTPYNVTENISGGAQAIPLRFFLLRDAINKPNDKEYYTELNTLYVMTPSLDITYKENRWEFNATPNLKLTKTFDFGEVKLYRFDRKLE